MLELKNPHSILAAISNRPAAVKQVRVQSFNSGDAWDDVVTAARQHNIPVIEGRSERAGPRGGRQAARGGGAATERGGIGSALMEPPSPIPLEILWQTAGEQTFGASRQSPSSLRTVEPFGLWLALDQIQDPQNLGALFRLAGFFGIRGILMTKDRSAPVNATVCDVAAGGTECVPFSLVANLAQALDRARAAGIWMLGTCERADQRIHQIQRDRHWMLVLGNEGQGMRRLTREKCDQIVSMPAAGEVASLNVATAAAASLAILTSPVFQHFLKSSGKG